MTYHCNQNQYVFNKFSLKECVFEIASSYCSDDVIYDTRLTTVNYIYDHKNMLT